MIKILGAISGEFFGVIFYTTTEGFVKVASAADLAFMLGFGIPFAFVGYLLAALAVKLVKK